VRTLILLAAPFGSFCVVKFEICISNERFNLCWHFCHQRPRLPDGVFPYQSSQFGYIFEGLAMVSVGILYGHLVYLRPFGLCHCHLIYFVVIWYIFSRFGMSYHKKSGKPARGWFSSNYLVRKLHIMNYKNLELSPSVIVSGSAFWIPIWCVIILTAIYGKNTIKPYTLAGFEPGIFCSVGGRDGRYATPPGHDE
jgi:hypothetical protein